MLWGDFKPQIVAWTETKHRQMPLYHSVDYGMNFKKAFIRKFISIWFGVKESLQGLSKLSE
jgi:hypothetical protein